MVSVSWDNGGCCHFCHNVVVVLILGERIIFTSGEIRTFLGAVAWIYGDTYLWSPWDLQLSGWNQCERCRWMVEKMMACVWRIGIVNDPYTLQLVRRCPFARGWEKSLFFTRLFRRSFIRSTCTLALCLYSSMNPPSASVISSSSTKSTSP